MHGLLKAHITLNIDFSLFAIFVKLIHWQISSSDGVNAIAPIVLLTLK